MNKVKIHIKPTSLLDRTDINGRSNDPACGTYVDSSHRDECVVSDPNQVTCDRCRAMIESRGLAAEIAKLYYGKDSHINMLNKRVSDLMTADLKGLRRVNVSGKSYLVPNESQLDIQSLGKGVMAYQFEVKIRRVKLELKTH